MNTFEDFKNAIGKKFKINWWRGSGSGLTHKADIIIKVHEDTGMIEGHAFIAHYSDCRFVQEQPAQLSKH